MHSTHLSQRPLKLLPNRVRRPFFGGYLLDLWQGSDNPQDYYKPEEWVASVVEARNPEPVQGEGLSRVVLEDGSVWLLKELIEKDAESFLGKEHVKRHGVDPAVLVKVLDSYTRLLIQVHPDREKAKNLFNSPYGKTEAWYILGGRKVNGEDPYVYLGFKPGITRKKWQILFEHQDIAAMEKALHKIPVKPGDVFLVEGGVPHAAGSGLFFLEIQEPTDFTIRTERKNMAGDPLSDVQLHQGLDFEKMFDCFNYRGLTLKETLNKWKLPPEVKEVQPGGKEMYLISSSHTSFFSMTRLEVTGEFIPEKEEQFRIVVVISGRGSIQYDEGILQVKAGDCFFLPAMLNGYRLYNDGKEPLIIINCYPPI